MIQILCMLYIKYLFTARLFAFFCKLFVLCATRLQLTKYCYFDSHGFLFAKKIKENISLLTWWRKPWIEIEWSKESKESYLEEKISVSVTFTSNKWNGQRLVAEIEKNDNKILVNKTKTEKLLLLRPISLKPTFH